MTLSNRDMSVNKYVRKPDFYQLTLKEIFSTEAINYFWNDCQCDQCFNFWGKCNSRFLWSPYTFLKTKKTIILKFCQKLRDFVNFFNKQKADMISRLPKNMKISFHEFFFTLFFQIITSIINRVTEGCKFNVFNFGESWLHNCCRRNIFINICHLIC